MLVSCENGDELIGICSIKKISKSVWYLNTFYVNKNYRSNGIGSKLYDICEKHAKKHHCEIIKLIVDPNFKDAIRFYEKRNYVFDKYDDSRKEIYYHKDIKSLKIPKTC